MKESVIVISNRNIVKKPKKWNGMFGNTLTKDQTTPLRIATGFLNRYENGARFSKLKLHEASTQETSLLDFMQSDQVDNNKPWVFFVHGDNQSTEKNFTKCAEIQRLYGVNLIVLSWPTQSLGKLKWFNLFSMVSKSKRKHKKNHLFKIVGNNKLVRKRMNAYDASLKIAQTRTDDFLNSISLVRNIIHPQVQQKKNKNMMLLVHSMGNYYMHEAHKTGQLKLRDLFRNLVMHQPDITETDHAKWCDELDMDNEKISITKNVKDFGLYGSSILNTFFDDEIQKNHRLGNHKSLNEHPEINYYDLSHFKGVKRDHEVAWAKKVSNDVKKVFTPLFK